MNQFVLTTTGTAQRLEIQFSPTGDRLSHSIYLLQGEKRIELFRSREGSDEEYWPASPPLQSCQEHDLGDGRRALLLVGMAGKSHWSLAVETDPQAARLVFDVACRTQGPPESLGSEYAVLAKPSDLAALRLELLPLEGGLETATLAKLKDHLRIVPPVATPKFPHTFRWKYAIRLEAVATQDA